GAGGRGPFPGPRGAGAPPPAFARRLDEAFAGPAAPGLNAYFAATRTGRRIGQKDREAVAEMCLSPGAGVVQLMREELPDAMMVYPWGQTEAEFEPTAIASLRHP